MNKPLIKVIAVATLFLFAFGVPKIRADQPRMDKAIELLQQAKKDAAPIPLLKQAREQVEKARHNKGGRRPEALEAIDDAITLAAKGEKPEGKINKAIALLNSGKDRGR